MKPLITENEPKLLPAGRGVREALRRQAERAEEVALSADFENEVMRRVQTVAHGTPSDGSFRRMAAIWLAVCLMGGLAYAAFRMSGGFSWGRKNVAVQDTTACVVSTLQPASGEVVRFVNQPLDSILQRVAAHYRRTVVFTDEELCTQRLLISWNTAAPLSGFIATLNELDGLHVRDVRDTLFVSHEEGEGDGNE